MTSELSPLLEVFYKLRARQLPLGPQDYLNALYAMARGFGLGSRQRLVFMCQTLWAKSPAEQQLVAEAFDAVLPPSLSAQELADYLRDIEATARAHEGGEQSGANQSPAHSPATADQKNTAHQPDTLPSASSSAPERPRLNFIQSSSPLDINLPAPPVRDWPINPDWDFTGQLPVTKRHLKGAWRYLRLMRRTGQCVELDVPGTIEQTYKQGVLLAPVLMPRRTNQARLLILVDEGGSMVPFRRQTEALLESAAHGGLRQVAIYFFHDVPLQYLFNDPRLTQQHAARIEEVLENFANVGVLILSDGGAARGNYDKNRVSQTAKFIGKLRAARRNVMWLNPTPADRWAGTTAERISAEGEMKMMSYDRTGLDAAVSALRGRGR